MNDQFIDTKNLVRQLIAAKATHPQKKIAFVFSGGGARAAWFGGILEAFEKEVRLQQPNVPAQERFAPDILVGTSGGGLAAVGYFADLMNSGQAGPYANRQSWLWREVSRGNAGALKLLDNPGILELVSGYKGDLNQDTSTSFTSATISDFLSPSTKPAELSPTTAFVKLQYTVEQMKIHWHEIQTNFAALDSANRNLITSFTSAYSRLNLQEYSAPWVNSAQASLNSLRAVNDAFNNINATVQGISFTKPVEAVKDVKDLFINSGNQFISALGSLNGVAASLVNIPISTIKSQFDDINQVVSAMKQTHEQLIVVLNSLNQFLIADKIKSTLDFIKALEAAIIFIKQTMKMIKNHSSLMNTGGLKNALQEILRYATPSTFDGNGQASKMDQGIFDHWQNQRDQKIINPLLRAPELIITASNITAFRLGLLTVCDKQTAINLNKVHTWVIGLNINSSAFKRGQELPVQRGSEGKSTDWIFGAWPNDAIPASHKLEVADVSVQAVDIGNDTTSFELRESPVLPEDYPFEQTPGTSFMTGTSLIAGAALTTAAIPIAFPPRLWHFENTALKRSFIHWFVDGGICDNRPIQQALDAGADIIVSFELTPLRKAIKDLPTSVNRPSFFNVASLALFDSQVNSAFYRFIESFVGNNIPDPGSQPTKQIWRIAPEVTADEDETIGIYDFNGVWRNGEFKMGLFDWFMRGYLDGINELTPSSVPKPKFDPVWDAYQSMNEYGQMKNAATKKVSPGYFVVDFINNRPHPGMGE